MAGKSLIELGKENEQIKNYIITDNEDVVMNFENSGNIIIYTNHKGEGIDDIDNPSTFTDLYIGDDHVAGGYGFRTTSDRNEAIDVITKQIPEMQADIANLKLNSGGSSSSESSEITNIHVSEKNKYFSTEDAKYRLNLDEVTGELSVFASTVEKIYNFELFEEHYTPQGVVYYTKENTAPDYICQEPGSLPNFTYMTFNYTGDEPITGLYFTYTLSSNSNIIENTFKTRSFYGSKQDIIPIDNDDKYPNVRITSEYMLSDPDIEPNVIQQKWRIAFDYNFINIFKKTELYLNQNIVDLKLNVVVSNRVVSATVMRVAFILPIFYLPIALDNMVQSDVISNFPGINKIFVIGDRKKYELSFNIYQSDYLKNDNIRHVVFIPTKIGDKEISEQGTTAPRFFLQSSDTKWRWEDKGMRPAILSNNKQYNYRTYQSPNKYDGFVTWLLEM